MKTRLGALISEWKIADCATAALILTLIAMTHSTASLAVGGTLTCFLVFRLTGHGRTHEQFQLMVENMPIGAVYVRGKEIKLNKRGEQITGYTTAELKSVDEGLRLLFQDRALEIRQMYDARKLSGNERNPRLALRRKDGVIRQVQFSCYYDGKTEIWVFEDLTERFFAEEKFRLIFEHSRDAYYLYDKNGIIDCNPSTLRIFELDSKNDIIGRHPAEFSPKLQPDGELSRDKAKRIIEAGENQPFQRFEWMHLSLKGREIPVEVTRMRVQWLGREVVMASLHDLTESKIVQQQLIHSSKMSSLGEMAGGIAHELNTPLQVILAQAQMIEFQSEANPLLLKKSQAIASTVQRMDKIISGLRSFARESEADPMMRSKASKLVEDTIAFSETRFSTHRIRLVVDVDDQAEVMCRPAQISQVLLNLLNNAFDAVSSNAGEKEITLAIKRTADQVEFSVTDNGCGISEENAAKLMTPFFTTKAVGKGTGLGLSIAQGIISDHHGQLTLDRQSTKTRFVFSLPDPMGERKHA